MKRGSILIKNGTIFTMNAKKEIFQGDILIKDGVIAAIGAVKERAEQVVDASGKLVLPGFIQTHVHLCQALFRGLADDVDVVDWLKGRIWPLESAHDEQSINASAYLAAAEMIAGGTTTALTMETALHTDGVMAAVEDAGLRVFTGSAMMDVVEPGTEMRALDTEGSFQETRRLFETWHGRDGGRIRCAVMPRGARNCSPELVERSRRFAQDNGLLMHTHVSENGPLSHRLKRTTGLTDMKLLEQQKVAGERLVIAHAVWLDEGDMEIVRSRGVKIAHCPSANLKLASGFAKIPELLDSGVTIGLGADGAPCNNNMDMMTEIRLASLMHKPRCGPTALPAYRMLEMATIEGARCLGIEGETGSLEVGKRGDVILMRHDGLHCSPMTGVPLSSKIVYSLKGTDVDTTIVDGRILYQNRRFTALDERKIVDESNRQIENVLKRTPFGEELLRGGILG